MLVEELVVTTQGRQRRGFMQPKGSGRAKAQRQDIADTPEH